MAWVFVLSLGMSLLAVPSWRTLDDGSVSVRWARVNDSWVVQAEGTLNASAQSVRAVLSNIGRYPEFLPYVHAAHAVAADGAYLRFKVPLILPNFDTEVTVHKTTLPNRFELAWTERAGAAPVVEKKLVRMPKNRGVWIVEPATSGKCHVQFQLNISPGHALPSSVEFRGGEEVLKALHAVETEANDRSFVRRTYGRDTRPQRPHP